MVPDQVPPTEQTTEASTDEKRKEALKGARERKTAYARDREDRDSYTERIKALVCKEREEVDPEEIEIIFTGDLSDAIIFIPEEPGSKTKIAHRLKPGA